MIRRNPTLIPVTEPHVQDIRELVARKKAKMPPDDVSAKGGNEVNAKPEEQQTKPSVEERLGIH